MDSQSISMALETWGYAALLGLLLLTAVGSPVPEDALLVAAGYLVFSDVFAWPPAVAICVIGVIGSDLMLYAAGRRLAWRPTWWSDRRWPPAERLARVNRWFDRLGAVVVLVARLVPGTRVLVFVAAGTKAIPVWSFLRYDALGAALWVPLMLAVGYAAGDHIGELGDVVATLRGGMVWVSAVAGLLLLLWLAWGREESKL